MNITKLLYEITEDERTLDKDCELMESGILDSLALIMLTEKLEEQGISLILTRIDKKCLSTPAKIEKLITRMKEAA